MDIAQIRGTILFIGAFLELTLTLILWFKGKTKASFHLGWTAFFSSVFCFSYGMIFLFMGNNLLWHRATWVGVLIVPASVTFVNAFARRIKYFRLKTFFWYLGAIIVLCFSLATPYFVKDVLPEYPYIRIKGVLEPWGRMYIISGVVALYYLFKEYFKSKGLRKLQIKYFIIGSSLPSIAGFLAAGVIPLFYPKFTHVDITAMATVPGVSLITYAIFKRRLFGIKVILTEILVVTISIILLIQALLAQTLAAKTLSSVTFFSFLLVGYLLIKVTQREIQRKEQAEILTKQLKHLNETLEDKVKQRTKDLEKSYQEIKERKDELERFYNLTVGRELEMLELKEKIKELKEKIQKDERVN